MSAHSCSFVAASRFSGVSKLAPGLANTKSVVEALLANWFWTVWNSWMPPNLSRLPNEMGTSPALLDLASICSNSANVLGTVLTLSLL